MGIRLNLLGILWEVRNEKGNLNATTCQTTKETQSFSDNRFFGSVIVNEEVGSGKTFRMKLEILQITVTLRQLLHCYHFLPQLQWLAHQSWHPTQSRGPQPPQAGHQLHQPLHILMHDSPNCREYFCQDSEIISFSGQHLLSANNERFPINCTLIPSQWQHTQEISALECAQPNW